MHSGTWALAPARFFCLSLSTILLLFSLPAHAVTATGNAYAQIAVPLTITRLNNIFFGTFAAGNGGTITIDTDGARTKTGDVSLLNSSYGAAVFRVRGTAGLQVNMELPTSITINKIGSPGASMLVDNFMSDPVSPLNPFSGDQFVTVGATLTAAPNQEPGNYTGTFNFTVNY